MSQYFPKPCEPFGDLSKLSDVVENDVVKKTAYDILVAKVNSTDTSAFVLKTKYDTDKIEIKIKIPNTTDLVKETDYNTKITEIEGKIPDVSNLATKTTLTAVENKISNVSSLVKKKKQIITLKLQKLKINIIIIITIKKLLLQSLILAPKMF